MQSECRLWNLSITALLVLSVYNILLTAKLMYSPDCPKRVIYAHPAEITKRTPCDPRVLNAQSQESFQNLDLSLGRWDNRLLYKYFDHIVVGDNFARLSYELSVCLATQTSLEKLFSLVQVTSHWTGAISVAVFAAGDEELSLILLYIIYLRQCFFYIKERVTFHLAFPKERQPKSVKVDFDRLSRMDCSFPELTLKELLKERSTATVKWRTKNPYPQNHLRNLARKNCQSRYVFLTDVDIIPSKHLAEDLDEFLRRDLCKQRCAYVIPTYEVDQRVRFPSNKTELIRLAKKGLARPFHQKVFIYNQYATNFSRWQNYTNESPRVHISHPVTNYEFLYEPFYVAPDTVPPHDERFMGYGYTRNTQVYEMFVAGYEFVVLSPVFTCHWGLQVKRGRPSWREQQNNKNGKHFDFFKKEVFARYNKDPLNMIARRKP